jgi:hypothetical protein
MTGPGDNLGSLDTGSTAQRTLTYLGPSLGFAMLPIAPELMVTSAGPFVVPPFASRILLSAACKSVILPSVAQWVQALPPQFNTTAFDRSIWIKDLIAAASAGGPIVITPAGSDTIDGLASYSIITPGDLIRLYPLTTLDGWYLG